MPKIIFGIDPGAKGGVAVIDSEGAIEWAGRLPYVGKQVDVLALRSLFYIWNPDRAVVEQQSIRSGQAGALSIGANYGRILGVLETLEVPHKIVTPAKWNKAAGIKPGTAGAAKKDQSYLVAKKLWGGELYNEFGLTRKTDGPIEALLIANFG